MRTKSTTPKRLLYNSMDTPAEGDHPNPGCCSTNGTAVAMKSRQTSDDMQHDLVNGSTKRPSRHNEPNSTANINRSQIFTFEKLDKVKQATVATKCSCHVPKKDQATQTGSDPEEYLATSPEAAATTTTMSTMTVNQPSRAILDLPSPSWSIKSSDSEGSFTRARTPTYISKVRRYTCTVCQKLFPTPSKLRRHFLIHSGEKPYSCKICGKPFNDPANLKRHHWSHVKERPFVCEECNGEFMAKRDAMMHICPATKRKRKLEMDAV